MKVYIILMSFVLGSAWCVADSGYTNDEDSGIFEGFQALADQIQEIEYTVLQTEYYVGTISEKKQIRVQLSKPLGTMRVDILNAKRVPSTSSYLVDSTDRSVLYHYGDTLAKAPEDEAQKHLNYLSKYSDQRLDTSGWEVYRLRHESHGDMERVVFALYDRNADNDGDWMRVWIDPGTGFIHRKEFYEGPGLLVTQYSDVRINHGLSPAGMRKGFDREGLPVMSLEETIRGEAESGN